MVSRRHRDVVMLLPLLALPDPPRTFSDELFLIPAAQNGGAKALPPPHAVNDGFWLPPPRADSVLARGSNPKIL
jgi:hypothetical protein